MKPSKKSPQVRKFLDELWKKDYGISRTEAIKNNRCAICKKKVEKEDFDSEKALKEFRISGFCQDCQNRIFKPSKSYI